MDVTNPSTTLFTNAVLQSSIFITRLSSMENSNNPKVKNFMFPCIYIPFVSTSKDDNKKLTRDVCLWLANALLTASPVKVGTKSTQSVPVECKIFVHQLKEIHCDPG